MNLIYKMCPLIRRVSLPADPKLVTASTRCWLSLKERNGQVILNW